LAIAFRSRDIAADPAFVISLAVAGAGVGLISSQLQNLVQSSVSKEQSSETSGLMATFQNLGMSLGTAIAGVALVGFLIAISTNLVNENTTLTQSQKDQYISGLNQKSTIMSNEQRSITGGS
jgi:MFS family permease